MSRASFIRTHGKWTQVKWMNHSQNGWELKLAPRKRQPWGHHSSTWLSAGLLSSAYLHCLSLTCLLMAGQVFSMLLLYILCPLPIQILFMGKSCKCLMSSRNHQEIKIQSGKNKRFWDWILPVTKTRCFWPKKKKKKIKKKFINAKLKRPFRNTKLTSHRKGQIK